MDVKIGSGSLSQNERRTQENHPNYKGKIVFDRDVRRGDKIWVAGWRKEGDDGKPWISLAVSITGDAPPRASAPRENAPSYEDEIPF